MLKNAYSLFVVVLFAAFFIIGCTDNATTVSTDDNNLEVLKPTGEITIWQSTDPVMLNPMNTTDANARRMSERIFQPLIQLDYFTYEIIAVLAKNRPVIKESPDGSSTMDFEIREEAIWDDTGEPITGEDVAFTLKVMKTPKVQNGPLRPYFSYIQDIIIDKNNPKQFTLICKEPYMIQESALTDFHIYPAHIYDPENVLSNFTVKQLSEGQETLKDNLELTKFAEAFNAPNFQNEIVVGSGPYELESWKPDQSLTLKRKSSWWGDAVEDANIWLRAYPERITFKTIRDQNTAVAALRNRDLDIMYRIDPRVFMEELREEEDFTADYQTGTPTQFIYSYMGMNTANDKFKDAKTRKAMRHLMDVEGYSENIFYGLAERVSTFIHPSKKKFVNDKLVLPDFNIEKAKGMLAEAGWGDSNQDGTLDRMINGERVDFKIEFLYPSVAKTSEKGVLIFQEACKKAGIELIPIGMDFKLMLEKLRKREFDMYFGLWQAAPVESDPTQLWHTNSINGGNNYVSFGDAKSDALIEKLTKELDEDKRAVYYKELEQIIDDEAPYIFLMASKNRLAIHKKVKDVKFSGLGNGYWSPGFIIENVAGQ